MKSVRHAARIALVCWAVGFFDAAAVEAGLDGAGALERVACSGLLRGADSRRVGSADGASVGAGIAAAGTDWSTVWQGADSAAALAFRQSSTSGLLGAIQEQCDMKSFSVQACRTALI
jgi:hypothetical protein